MLPFFSLCPLPYLLPPLPSLIYMRQGPREPIWLVIPYGTEAEANLDFCSCCLHLPSAG